MASEMRNEEVLDKIERFDRILVGIGEEFDESGRLRQKPQYADGCGRLKSADCDWLIPAWNDFWREKLGDGNAVAALERLAELLEGKNVFAVSTSVNSKIAASGIRTVMPCGTGVKKQCVKGCGEVIQNVSEEEHNRLWQAFEMLADKKEAFCEKLQEMCCLGTCPKCGAPLVLNTVYAENYNEHGYLEQWNAYTKWLQGTLNHKLLVLELGVGMQFPSVIRWPFEKVVFFNQKAFLCRVNEKLYQLTEELAGKGCGISMNAIDWLKQL